MPWIEFTARLARRVDVRLVAVLIALFAPLIGTTLLFFYAYAAHELLEEVARDLKPRSKEILTVLEMDEPLRKKALRPLEKSLIREEIGYSIQAADGETLVAGGADVEGRLQRDNDPLFNSLRVKSEEVIARSTALPNGKRLIVSARLEHFVEERGELQNGLWMSLGAGLLLAAGVALFAARQALAPLRRTTSIIADVDAGGLHIRVPERGTQDDVDQHARVLNRVLDRLEQGFARIRSFSSDVAHELRTPINRLLNRVEVEALDAETGSAARDMLLAIRSSVEEMSHTVDALLLLSRADEGSLSLHREPVEVSELLETLRDLYEVVCHERGIALDVKAQHLRISGDRTLLIRAISNLVDNAIRHSSPGGTIWISTLLAQRHVEIWVEDQGSGVPEEDRERIFDRFVRLDSAPKSRGSGLGLPIARSIARAHAGELWAEAREGGGARFRLRLPGGNPQE